MNSKYNYESSGNVTRTASFCELESELELSSCDVMQRCFEDSSRVDDWSTCMEDGVRAVFFFFCRLVSYSSKRQRGGDPSCTRCLHEGGDRVENIGFPAK